MRGGGTCGRDGTPQGEADGTAPSAFKRERSAWMRQRLRSPPPKKKGGGERRRADGATSGGCGVRVGQRPPASKGKQGVRTGRHRLPGESGWDDTWGRNTRAGRCPARRAGRESETVPESGTREQHAPPPKKKTAKHASAPAPQKGVASAHESAMSKGYTRTATRQPRRSRQRSCRTPCTFPQKAP